jgi:hypothetical protein
VDRSKGLLTYTSADEEPFISDSGDLTHEKIAKLVETSIDNAGAERIAACLYCTQQKPSAAEGAITACA